MCRKLCTLMTWRGQYREDFSEYGVDIFHMTHLWLHETVDINTTICKELTWNTFVWAKLLKELDDIPNCKWACHCFDRFVGAQGTAQLTFGWFDTKQCSQTFTRCSKQNKFVTFFFGHLHNPIITPWTVKNKYYFVCHVTFRYTGNLVANNSLVYWSRDFLDPARLWMLNCSQVLINVLGFTGIWKEYVLLYKFLNQDVINSPDITDLSNETWTNNLVRCHGRLLVLEKSQLNVVELCFSLCCLIIENNIPTQGIK